MKINEIIIPEGFEVDKVENNKIILKQSKKELPVSWEECLLSIKNVEFIDSISRIQKNKYNQSSISSINNNALPIGYGSAILFLCQLLICREVYRQGWKPDYTDDNTKYVILNVRDTIVFDTLVNSSCILSFQSAEIRNKFYLNFKDLIIQAKDLI